MINKSINLVLTCILVGLSFVANAQTSYISVSDGSWDDPDTWNPVGVPNVSGHPYDDVTVSHNVSTTGSLRIVGNGSSITVASGGNLYIDGNLRTGNWGTPAPSLTVESGGIIDVRIDFFSEGADAFDISGTLNARNFATSGAGSAALTISGLMNLSGEFTHNVARTLTLNNGKIITGSNFTIGTSSARLVTTGATINVGGNLTVQGSARFDHASDTLLVAGDFINSGSVGVDFYGRVDINGNVSNQGSSDMTFNGPTTIGSLTGTGATTIFVNSELLIENDVNLSGSADIQGGGSGGVIGWNGTFTTDNSGSSLDCDDGTQHDGHPSAALPPPPFNPLDLGTCGDGDFDLVPVEIGYFRGYLNSGAITLEWSTLTEENNDYFTIYRSLDGINFITIGNIKGAGNSNETILYNFTDYSTNPPVDGYYYRIGQTDFDGTSSLTDIIYVSLTTSSNNIAWVKNPATNNEIVINLSDNNIESLEFSLVNAIGKNMNFGKIENIGNQKFILKFNEKLSSGLYILTIQNQSKQEFHRIMVK